MNIGRSDIDWKRVLNLYLKVRCYAFTLTLKETVQKTGSEDMVVEDQYVCENVDVEGEHDYDSIVSAIIMERYDANKRDAIFSLTEMARDTTSVLDEDKRAEYLKRIY